MPEFLLCCIVCLHSLCWALCCHGHIVSGTWLSYLKAVSSMSMLHCTSVLVVDIISEWKHLCHPLPIKCFLNHYILAWIIRLIWRNNENKSPKICVLPIFDVFFPLFYILLAKWILPYTIFFSWMSVCGILYPIPLASFWVFFTILSFLLGTIFPTTCMQQPVLPYQERVHNQPSSRREQGRLAPIPQWKQVKKLLMNTIHCLHPTPAITILFLNPSFSSTLCETVILSNFQWIKSTVWEWYMV